MNRLDRGLVCLMCGIYSVSGTLGVAAVLSICGFNEWNATTLVLLFWIWIAAWIVSVKWWIKDAERRERERRRRSPRQQLEMFERWREKL